MANKLDVVLRAAGGDITVGRQISHYVYGSFDVVLPEGREQQETDDRIRNGFIYRPADTPDGLFDIGFVRADVTLDLNARSSNLERVVDSAVKRVEGDVFFERDIGPAGVHPFVPGIDFDENDTVSVELWNKRLPLPVTAIDFVETDAEGLRGVRVHVGGQMISDAEALRSSTDTVLARVEQERRQRLKSVESVKQIANDAQSTASSAVEKAQMALDASGGDKAAFDEYIKTAREYSEESKAHSEESVRASEEAQRASLESRLLSRSAGGYSATSVAFSAQSHDWSLQSQSHSQKSLTYSDDSLRYSQAAQGYSATAKTESDRAVSASAEAKAASESAAAASTAAEGFSESARAASDSATALAPQIEQWASDAQSASEASSAASAESQAASSEAAGYSSAASSASDAAISAQGLSEAAFKAAESERKLAEEARSAAESARATAEAGRDEAEAARRRSFGAMSASHASMMVAESARAQAEDQRKLAESARADAELKRSAAETARSGAESARSAAETARDLAEGSRASAESERKNAESARSAAEGFRDSAETARSSAESERQAAETARSAAEGFRDEAEAKRAAAETERSNAELARADAEDQREIAEAQRQATVDEATRLLARVAEAQQESSLQVRELQKQLAEPQYGSITLPINQNYDYKYFSITRFDDKSYHLVVKPEWAGFFTFEAFTSSPSGLSYDRLSFKLMGTYTKLRGNPQTISIAPNEVYRIAWAETARALKTRDLDDGALTPAQSSWIRCTEHSFQATDDGDHAVRFDIVWSGAAYQYAYGMRVMVNGVEKLRKYQASGVGPLTPLGNGVIPWWVSTSKLNLKAGDVVNFEIYCTSPNSWERSIKSSKTAISWIGAT